MDTLFNLLLLLVIGLAMLIVAGIVYYRRVQSARPTKYGEEEPLAETRFEVQALVDRVPETIPPEIAIVDESEDISHIPDSEDSVQKNITSPSVEDDEPIESTDAQGDEADSMDGIAIEREEAVEAPQPLPPIQSDITVHRRRKRTPLDSIPGRRGPRPVRDRDSPEPSKRKSRALKPEVVCWKKMRRWVVGIEVPEELLECTGLAVTQDAMPLSQEDDGRWGLQQVTGKVNVCWEEAESPIEIDLGDRDESYLVFRLVGDTLSRGRLVRNATVGWYLVISPETWERDEQVSGPPVISAEPVAIPGYRAHYFSPDRGTKEPICFRTSGDEAIVVPTHSSRFELIGAQIPDASEELGPLFGKRPPRIRALDVSSWRDIETIVVGQEGRGRKRWRTSYSPDTHQVEQGLPSEVSERLSGWHFIRFYDTEDNLIESLDFRFANALKDIRILHHTVLPGSNGHSPAKVEFLRDVGCAIKLSHPSTESLTIEHDDMRTSVTIPPDPTLDRTRWLIRPDRGAPVEATILVDRVWWAIGEESTEQGPVYWEDESLTIPRDWFAATSEQAIWFRFPRTRWTREIHVGFARERARTYPIKVAEREVAVPMADFDGYAEIEDSGQDHFLRIWVKDATNEELTGVVALIPAAQLADEIDRYQGITDQPTRHRQLSSEARRLRKYLWRLRRRTQDSALRELICRTRAKWSVSDSQASSRRLETACVITLTWEIHKADGMKPLGHRKRWVRRFIRLVRIHPETMQSVRENYERLKHDDSHG